MPTKETTYTATYVKTLTGWRGDARVYRLSKPAKDNNNQTVDHVVVSAAYTSDHGPETYIFPWNVEKDEPHNFGEMDGSFIGGLDHERALRDAGYEIALPPPPHTTQEPIR